MSTNPIVIVGAGPAGLVLALSLAQYKVHSVILEKEISIGEDPRGVYLAGDAVRVLYQLGIGDQMDVIGHRVKTINFHKTSFQKAPFLLLEATEDWLEQIVPGGILQIQPRLEATLRAETEKSSYCELRRGCRVFSREETETGVIVSYENDEGKTRKLKGSWLVGADGKTGVVRKRFLEPIADIKQEVGLFEYNGTWVAANLHITLPTPQSHPELCFWDLGMTPEDVYDLFWPDGWHFCSPPGKATACGRFGPREARLWRHEFAEPNWNDSKNAVQLLWEHLIPLITRESDGRGHSFPTGSVMFPRDCINIRRCRPFTFCQKVVNKWFHNKTILIGDAAHVFPPFGGQGIASGIRDADSLAWRLAVLCQLPAAPTSLADKMLLTWSHERRQGVDDSTRLTKMNGMLCNGTEDWVTFFLRALVAPILSLIPGMPSISQISTAQEKEGYRATKDGFFLRGYGGGGKLSQMYVKADHGLPVLSDSFLRHGQSVMTLLVLDAGNDGLVAEIETTLKLCKVPESLLSMRSIVVLSTGEQHITLTNTHQPNNYQPCSKAEVSKMNLPGYNVGKYFDRFPRGAKYVIIRPDFIIFATAKTSMELGRCLELLTSKI